MTIELLGYSERGMVNALCYDMSHTPSLLPRFLSWIDFVGMVPGPDFGDIESATLLVEQSFSDFGDLDLLILLKHKSSNPQAILIEAKVSNDTNSWLTVDDRWDDFLTILDGGEGNSSNLFVQLHRKVRLVAHLRNGGDALRLEPLLKLGSLGENRVVEKAADVLRTCVKAGNAYFVALLPDEATALASFARDKLQARPVEALLKTWNPKGWGFLSWQTIAGRVNADEWPKTESTFRWNKGQVFRIVPPVQHLVETGQIYLVNGNPVYAVSVGGHQCRVVDLNTDNQNSFWRSRLVDVGDMTPCDAAVPMTTLPTLPRIRSVYTWNCQDKTLRLPPGSVSIEIECGTEVIVMRADWLTTRVRFKESAQETPGFLVYTHHLQRMT